jgi:hypothetical protein
MRTALVLAVLAACGHQDPVPPADAAGTVIDGVIYYPDASLPDATSATTGAIMVTIRCAGSTCGKTGTLRVRTDDCSGGNLSSKALPARTLTAGVDIDATFGPFAPGAYCASAYLDLTGNGLDPGDPIASAGQTPVTVTAGTTAQAVVTLDAFQQ